MMYLLCVGALVRPSRPNYSPIQLNSQKSKVVFGSNPIKLVNEIAAHEAKINNLTFFPGRFDNRIGQL